MDPGEDRREGGGKRVHESTTRAPLPLPQVRIPPEGSAFRDRSARFPSYIRVQHPQSRLVPPLFTSRFDSRVLDRV